MAEREQVIDALKHIVDPTYKKSAAELGFVRDIMTRDEQISLTFVLTNDSDAVKQELEREIKDSLAAIGERKVHMRFRMITDHERDEIENGKKSSGPRKKVPTHGDTAPGQGLLSPILAQDSGVEFISVASGKGGVGKSTVTVNLAAALANQGKKVGIMDADIYGFSVPDMMGIDDRPALQNNRIIPIERFGVKVVSMGFFVQDNNPVIWRGPMLGKMLRNYFTEVDWGELDYLLLDLPPGTGDMALDVHQMIPQSKEIIVTTPHGTAAFVAARAGAMALQTDHDILGVVENMAYYQCGECGHKDYVFGRGGGAKLAEELRTDLLAQIPLGVSDRHVSEPDFAPSVYRFDSEIGKLYAELATSVLKKSST